MGNTFGEAIVDIPSPNNLEISLEIIQVKKQETFAAEKQAVVFNYAICSPLPADLMATHCLTFIGQYLHL